VIYAVIPLPAAYLDAARGARSIAIGAAVRERKAALEAQLKNGPGVFERAGVRKRTLLDGDGLITAYRISDGRVQYQSRFVRTPKFEAEQAAGRFLFDSWTTPIHDDPSKGGGDQAGVTVWPWGDRLYAFDEGNPGWQLKPEDLSTVGQATFGLPPDDAVLFAHGKQLAQRAEFALFGALEPVFAPRPGGSAEDDGWLLVEVANADTGRAALCVFDARRLADGPIAAVHLKHHTPMRFHGRWAPA